MPPLSGLGIKNNIKIHPPLYHRADALVVLHIYSCVSDEMPIGKYCRLGYAGMEENIEDRDDDVGVGEKGNAWIGFERP